MVPTVHMNGTNPIDLVEQLCTASGALADALAALRKAMPNGRDYYPQGREALTRATGEHESRIWAVQNVKDQIDKLAELVADGGAK